MKKHATMIAAAAALTLALSAPAQAQGVNFFLGGGATIPVGDFKEFAKTGWMASAGVIYTMPTGVFVFGELFYGENKHEALGEKTNPYGGMANLGYRFGDQAKPGLYVYGGIGVLVHKFTGGTLVPTASSPNFAYDVATGVDIPLGGVTLWNGARYMGGDTAVHPDHGRALDRRITP